MLFNSSEFLIFFPIVVLVYYIIPDRIKYLWLLAASYYFYMCWNARYALLILFSTTVTYVSGLLLERQNRSRATEHSIRFRRKLIVAGSFVLNLSILFYFKYVNFALSLLGSVLGMLRIKLVIPQFDILLPVGISFYTFQALGYTMDVYRDEVSAERNFFRYALFVSFFPQLVAGPIERSGSLLQQLSEPHRISWNRTKDGVLLMLWGFFLKIVLADRIALFVDTIYGDPIFFPGWYLVVATILFAIQIYCDFYGYSVIAMGAAEILGIRLMENFNAPYLSCSVSEFWSRWHISLTSWFRDYLYIPLGGNRKGKPRKYLNKMIVFAVSGLWHGASLSYMAWGMLNGIYQVIGEVLQPIRQKAAWALGLHCGTIAYRLAGGIVTFALVDFSWIFFRADRLTEALAVVNSIFHASNPWILFDGSLYQCGLDAGNFCLMMVCILILLFSDLMKHRGISVRNTIAAQDAWAQCLVVVLSVAGILLFGIWGPEYSEASFIYFQF